MQHPGAELKLGSGFLLSETCHYCLDHGEVDLKPFDMVVQRGTNHAWEVIGDEPALFVAVLP